VRILHTSDWHVGKRLGRYDRSAEYASAIDEVVTLADAEGVDVVVHSGDLFDRPQPPIDALRLAFDGLRRLAAGGARPVVVVAGNHDSPDLFETLAPYMAPAGIHLVGHIKPPAAGGLISVETAAGRAVIACFPFLRQGRAVDFMADTGRWYGAYADRVRTITEAYAAAARLQAGDDGIAILAAHFMVTGARVGGHGSPRGERELHMGEAYAATAAAIPPSLAYVAMGHIHAPQPVPGANVPAEYAGSLLAFDFGEAGEAKRVVLVDAVAGSPAKVTSFPLRAGRSLVRATGTWDELAARTDLGDVYVDLVVATDGPDPGLADRARLAFPYLVKVRAEFDRGQGERRSRHGRPLAELYSEFSVEHHGAEPPPEVAAAFIELLEEVGVASP
jgi:exonuclease SbcD